jgi:hypothetical protein
MWNDNAVPLPAPHLMIAHIKVPLIIYGNYLKRNKNKDKIFITFSAFVRIPSSQNIFKYK